MLKLIDHCVRCEDMGLHCLGNSCPNKKSYLEFCDLCDSVAKYCIDGVVYCKDCADNYLNAAFNDLNTAEKADLLDVDFSKVNHEEYYE